MIREDIRLDITDEKSLDLLGKSKDRVIGNPTHKADFYNARGDLAALSKPIVVWKAFSIEKFVHDKVILTGGIEIGGGPVVRVIGGAEKLVLGICTIGDSVEEKAKECTNSGSRMRAIFLDMLGSWAVDATRKKFAEWIKEHLSQEDGWRTSTLLSPGESEWDVKDQAVIFNLLQGETEEAGIRLTDLGVLIPMKSISFLIGIGRQPLGVEDATNCDFCSQRESCRYKHMCA